MNNVRLCGQYGHKTKTGASCGYRLANEVTACPHHSTDKTKQQALIEKAMSARRETVLPDTVSTNDFATIDDCLRVRAQVVEILRTAKQPDYRRLDMILKATTGASTDHATKAMKEQNDILLMLEGHGAGVAALQRLRGSSIRILPRKRGTDKEPDPAGNA